MMRSMRWGAAGSALLFLALMAGAAALSADSASADGRPIRHCLLVAEGRTILNGPCQFEPLDRDGSFIIRERAAHPYFAYLLKDGANGHGYWNGQRNANHAEVDLGMMVRRGACWENRQSRICARN